MLYRSTNQSAAALAVALTANPLDTTIHLQPGQGDKFWTPVAAEWFALTLSNGPLNEITYCTQRVGDTLTVVRGQEGTAPQAWPVNTTAQNFVTAGQLNAMLQALDKGVKLNEWACRVVGDAVLQPDGSWLGTDVTAALRAEWLHAVSLGLKLYIAPGYYIVSGQIVGITEAFDNCGCRGEPGRTWIIAKTGSQPANFTMFDFAGLLENDGVTGPGGGNPTIYMTAPATQSTDIITLNDTAANLGIVTGKSIMLMDMTHTINQYFYGGLAGLPVSIFGQVSEVVQLGGDPPDGVDIKSGTYDDPTGQVTLVPVTSIPIGQNVIIRVSNLTGTGDNLHLLEGDYTTQTGTGAVKILYMADDGLNQNSPITITGGRVDWNVIAANQIRIRPSLEANYAGTAVNPFTQSTCIRRLSKSPVNVEFSGINFTADLLTNNISTQRKITMRALTRPKIWDCEFWGLSVDINITDGTHQFDVKECAFFNGGNGHTAFTLTGGCYQGRITRCRSYNIRHLTNTTSNLLTSAAAHIVTANCQTYGNRLSSFTDHPGVRNLTWVDCLVCGNTGGAISAGFQMRGYNEAVINCRVYGCYYGATCSAGSNNTIDGGYFANCVIGLYVSRGPNFTIKNFPQVVDAQIAGMWIDNVVVDAFDVPPPAVPYQLPFPGLFVEAQFQTDSNSPPSTRGDVVYVLRSTDQPPKMGDDWRFNCRAVGRSVRYGCTQASGGASNFIWPGEYGPGIATKFTSFTCPPGLESTYVADSSHATVPIVATLPNPAFYPASKLWLRKMNTGGQPVSVAGFPIDGVVNPVIPDNGRFNIISNVQNFRIANTLTNAYNSTSGALLLIMIDPNDIFTFTGTPITIWGLTGTGNLAALQGTFPLDAGSFARQIRCHVPLGAGVITITGGFVSWGPGWITR